MLHAELSVNYLLRAIKDWVQQFRCCIWAKFRSTFHIVDLYLELLRLRDTEIN